MKKYIDNQTNKPPVAKYTIRFNGWLTLPDDFLVFGLSVFKDMVH